MPHTLRRPSYASRQHSGVTWGMWGPGKGWDLPISHWHVSLLPSRYCLQFAAFDLLFKMFEDDSMGRLAAALQKALLVPTRQLAAVCTSTHTRVYQRTPYDLVICVMMIFRSTLQICIQCSAGAALSFWTCTHTKQHSTCTLCHVHVCMRDKTGVPNKKSLTLIHRRF